MMFFRFRRSLIALLLLSIAASWAPAWAEEPAQAAQAPSALETRGLSGCAQARDIWQTSETLPQIILSCTVTTAESGKLVISASGYAFVLGNLAGAGYEAGFSVSVGATTRQNQYVDTNSDSHDSNDQAVSLTAGANVAAGTHTVAFKGWRVSASGSGAPVTLGKTALSVFFVPDSSTDVEVCFSVDSAWSNATTTEAVVAQCSITPSVGGRLFIFGSGTAHLKDSAYEAAFTARRVGGSNAASDRYVNVTTNANDGTDRAVATVAAELIFSTATFNVALYGRRSLGSGTVGLRNVSLVAVFIAASNNNPATYCDDTADRMWNANLYNFDTQIATCTLVADAPGWLLVIGSGSMGHLSGAVGDSQITTRLTVDGAEIGASSKANIYPNGDDGTDATTASATMIRVLPGSHTIYYTAQKVRGDASKVVIRDGGMAAIFIPAAFSYIPGIRK